MNSFLNTRAGRGSISALLLIAMLFATGIKAASPAQTSILDEADRLNAEVVRLYREGRFDEAIPLAERALALRVKALGPDDPRVGQSLNNLAGLYYQKGDYQKVEPLFERALAIRIKSLGANHPDVATSLNNLAGLYYKRGDYQKAEPLFRQALAIYEKSLGTEHHNFAQALNNLAAVYYEMKQYRKAVPMYERALLIYERTSGADDPAYGQALNNLAESYRALGDYQKAEPLLRQALDIRVKALGPNHPDVAETLNNLAGIYYLARDYQKAEPLLRQALDIRVKALGPNHPDVASSLDNLAALYEARGEIAQAVTFSTRSNNIIERNINLNLATGSERQKLLYLATLSGQTDATISLQTRSAPADPLALRLALTTVLRRKGRTLDSMTDSFGTLRRRLTPSDQSLLDQLMLARSRLAALVLGGLGEISPDEYKADVARLEIQVDNFEAQVSARSAEFRAQSHAVTLESVQAAIPAGAVLVEFVSYYPFNAKTGEWEARRYAVYLLSRQGEPKWADLGPAEKIDNAVAGFRATFRRRENQPLSDIERQVKPQARALDQLVMQPVRRLAGDTFRLLISPDGALNLVPFAALVDEQNRYLVERYSISYLASGRDLLRLQTGIQPREPAVVIADPDFNYGAKPGEATGPRLAEMSFEPLKRLRASAQEAARLKEILGVEPMTGAEASESMLKPLSGPRLLHIATHGFFLKDEETGGPIESGQGGLRIVVRRKNSATESAAQPEAAMRITNPLLRSGLFLAGANAAHATTDDGMLTALEASGLDLWGTKLIVLSACDTGVGEVSTGEGVYGLRRALVLAGSESQMMSLWPVSDTGTSELMMEYYTRLKAGAGRSDALRQVQLKMLKDPERNHPFYWASFIQSGEWASLDGKR